MRRPLTIQVCLVAVVLLGASQVRGARRHSTDVVPCSEGCGKAARPWISLTFSGDGWTARTVQTVLGDLRADMAQRQIDLDLPANRKQASGDPIASIDIAKEGASAVAIQVDIPEGGATRRLSRVTVLDAVPNDGRPLAIALTAGELLRVSWVRIALRRAAEKAAVASPERPAGQTPTPTPTPATAGTAAEPSAQMPPASELSTQQSAPATSPAPTEATAPLPSPVSERPPPTEAPPNASDEGQTPQVPPPPPDVSPAPTDVMAFGRTPPGQAAGPLNFGIAIGGALLVAAPLSTRNVPTSKALGFRGSVSGQRFGISVGLLLPTEVSLELGDATARERRFVFDAGARTVWRGRSVNAGVDLGLLLAYRHIDGVGLLRNAGSSGVDPGVRAGFVVAFGGSQVAPWVGAAAEVLPFSPSIDFAPAGDAGRSPVLWLGVGAGVSARLTGRDWP